MEIRTQKKLNHLAETKQMIREAIEQKGQTISDADPFRSYAGKILGIASGSAEREIVSLHTVITIGTVKTTDYGKHVVEHNLGVVPDIVMVMPYGSSGINYTGSFDLLGSCLCLSPRPELFGDMAGDFMYAVRDPKNSSPAYSDFCARDSIGKRQTMEDWINKSYDGPVSLIKENTIQFGGPTCRVTKDSKYHLYLVGIS
jgi:hypothetical protein